MLNRFVVVEKKGKVTVVIDVEETLNIRSGDVDQVLKCNFYNEACTNIGYAKVVDTGFHVFVRGDYNGKELLNKFHLLER